jgi:predicted Rdx family selenoprotein
MKAPSIDEEELQLVYQWVDSVPLSRPKKNISRDFSDACKYLSRSQFVVLMAEIIHHFIPRLVDVHNYPGTGSLTQKEANWNTLNIK